MAGSPAQVQRIRRVYRWFAPAYDGFRAFWSLWNRKSERELDRLFRERIGPDTRILELAPGTGINIRRLLRRGREFGSYLGIDASEEMLARARAKVADAAGIELRLGDVTELAALPGAFDFVVSTWMLSHLDEPTAVIRDAVAHLAPGGSAVFVFLTEPRGRLLAAIVRAIGGPFSYRCVSLEPILALDHVERVETFAWGTATLVVFRMPDGE